VRAAGRSGELVLREADGGLELIVNGVFLMDSHRGGESERVLASEALADCATGAPRCLVGGLGFGYTVSEILTRAPAAQVTCAELEAAVIECLPLLRGVIPGSAALAADPRVSLVHTDVLGWAAQTAERFDAVLLDVDNGPSWLVRPENAHIYQQEGLDVLAGALRPGGVLGVWSAQAEPAFKRRLARRFATLREVAVPVERGQPDVIYLAR
jgi:spermidine synthase